LSAVLARARRADQEPIVRLDPTVTFLLVLVIGTVIGVVVDRVASRGWLSRQLAGGSRNMVTSALVGIAGSFIGYHLVLLLRLGGGVPRLIGAAAGALAVVWLWRAMR
jgi:uncharacterized membrane protein YeaQ/YmgE (transglycosylase-associated protein family)